MVFEGRRGIMYINADSCGVVSMSGVSEDFSVSWEDPFLAVSVVFFCCDSDKGGWSSGKVVFGVR